MVADPDFLFLDEFVEAGSDSFFVALERQRQFASHGPTHQASGHLILLNTTIVGEAVARSKIHIKFVGISSPGPARDLSMVHRRRLVDEPPRGPRYQAHRHTAA